MALLGGVQRVEPGVEFLAAFGKAQRRIVSDVVATAHEGVDGAQGLALASRQNQKSVVEILGGSSRDAAADRIRHDELRLRWSPRNGNLLRAGAQLFPPLLPRSLPRAARATSASLRGFEIAGRFPRTAQFCRSIARKISWPPRLKSSKSMASSRSTLPINGSPCRNQSRARSTSNFIMAQKAGVLCWCAMSSSATPKRRRSSSGR